jgi:hemolysin D
MPEVLNGRISEQVFEAELLPDSPQPVVSPQADDWSETAKEAIDALPKVWTRGLLYFIALFTAIILPWAMLSKYDETGTGRGRIETKGTSNRLESATAGGVLAVHVQEGQKVKEGQVLLELESDAVRSELQQAKTKLEGQMNRLSQLGIAKNQVLISIATQQQQNKAQAMEKQAQSEQAQQNVADQRSTVPLADSLKLTQMEQVRKSLSDSEVNLPMQQAEKAAQLRQARQKLAAAQTTLTVTNSKYKQSLVEVQRYDSLWKQGGVPKTKLIEVQGIAKDNERLAGQAQADVNLAITAIKEQEENANRVIHQLQADISQAKLKVQQQEREYQQLKAKQKSELKQAESRVKEQQGNRASITEAGKLAVLKSEEQQKDLQSQMGTLGTEIDQTKQQIEELERQLKQKVVRSPVDGTVLQLPFKQPKTFVQMGQLVAQVAPSNASTILKVQMPSSNSGFLKPGMAVKVKFDAYPFQDYGVVNGKVLWVSPDSKLVEAGTTKIEAFEMEVVLDREYIQSQGKKVALTLGQTATAEVIVRQRRTIDLILDPFKKLQQGGGDP